MIESYLNKQVFILRISKSVYGRTTGVARTPVAAFVVWKTRLLKEQNGQATAATGIVYMPPGTDVRETDQIEVLGHAYKVASIDNRADFSASHLEVSIT